MTVIYARVGIIHYAFLRYRGIHDVCRRQHGRLSADVYYNGPFGVFLILFVYQPHIQPCPFRWLVLSRLFAFRLGAYGYAGYAVGVAAASHGVVARFLCRLYPVRMRERPEVSKHGRHYQRRQIHPFQCRHGIHPFVFEHIVIHIVVVYHRVCHLLAFLHRHAVYVQSLRVARPVKSPVADFRIRIFCPVGGLRVPVGRVQIDVCAQRDNYQCKSFHSGCFLVMRLCF